MQVNIYMGLGLLSMPYAMRLAGWFGLLALMASTAVFCISAKLLIRAFQTLPAGMLHSYPNLGVLISSMQFWSGLLPHWLGRNLYAAALQCRLAEVLYARGQWTGRVKNWVRIAKRQKLSMH